MFNTLGKLLLVLVCFASAGLLSLRAAEEDDEEGPANAAIKAAREARERKAKLSAEAPKDPALPKDANDPIDLKAMTQKEALAEAKEKESAGAIDPKKFAPNANPALSLGAAGKGVCQGCQGQRIVPILPYVPFVKIHDSDPANNPEIQPTYKPCPVCNAKFNVKEFLTDIKEHQDKASAKNKDLEQQVGVKLLQAENQFVSVRTSLTSRELKKIMTSVEKLSALLTAQFQSMTLLTARPEDGSIIFITEAKQFDKLVDKVLPDSEYKEFCKKVRSCTFEGNHISCLDPLDLQYESHAIFSYAHILMTTATNGNAPIWLSEGFADYCEWAVRGKNEHHSVAIAYGFSAKDVLEQKVKFSANWVADIRKIARDGKLSPYNSMMHFDLVGMKRDEYLTCMGVVCCLVKTSPRRFDQMVQFIRDGEDPAVAMEKAFGRKLPEMEKFWTS